MTLDADPLADLFEPHLEPADAAPAPPRRTHLRKVLLWLLAALLFLGSIPVAVIGYAGYRLDHNLHRIPGVFDGLTNRPARPTTGTAANAMNILLLGTDRRSGVPTTGSDAQAPAWVPGAQRSDAIMVVHLDGDRRGASVISIPRDSWVDVPGHGMNKVNAAFSLGGPSLAVATVEKLTGVRIDHLAVIDWAGFSALTDAVGGVDVQIPETVHDSARHITWTAGLHHLDGQQALNYVGQRYGLPGGDLDRVQRQQAFLRALMQSSLHQEMRKDPKLLYDFLSTVTTHLSVDSGWSAASMAKLLLSMVNMRSADIAYTTVPVRGTGWQGDQSVVRLAPGPDRVLWQAVRRDRTPEWAAIHWRDLTGAVVD